MFVDPKGWTGAELTVIATLLAEPHRDVLVNVMYNFINRFKGDPRDEIRASIRRLFNLGDQDLDPSMTEDELFERYRSQLKKTCGVRFAGDLFIQHPTQDRTWFRLVVGGGDPEVIKLFRDVEQRVVGKEGGAVRQAAKKVKAERKTGQPDLPFGTVHKADKRYYEMNKCDLAKAPDLLLAALATRSPQKYGEIWPEVLEVLRITRAQLNAAVGELHKQGRVAIVGAKPKQRIPYDENLLALATQQAP